MPMAGRGRGRGRGALAFDAIKKPGAIPAEESEISKLSKLIQALEQDESKVLEVVEAARHHNTDESQIKKMLNVLYERCVANWKFSHIAAVVCQELVSAEGQGSKFRAVLLRQIQADFSRKDSLRTDCPERFLGCVSFLCQILGQLRSVTGEPFAPLVNPVFEALEQLLDDKATDEEMTCAVSQLLENGALLKERDSERLQKITDTVRSKILDNKGSRECRTALITIIEANAGGWTKR